jgi:hypothetical protein
MSDDQATFANTIAKEKVVKAAYALRRQLASSKRRDLRDAWAVMETYLAVSMRVMDRVPLAEVRDAAVTEEIKARLHSRAVV